MVAGNENLTLKVCKSLYNVVGDIWRRAAAQLSLAECLHQSGHLWPTQVLSLSLSRSDSLRPHRVRGPECSVKSRTAGREDSSAVTSSQSEMFSSQTHPGLRLPFSEHQPFQHLHSPLPGRFLVQISHCDLTSECPNLQTFIRLAEHKGATLSI